MSISTGPLTFSQVRARLVSENGTHEYPAHSNRQKFGVWYGWNGVPWCAIFMSWGFRGSTQQMGGKVSGVWTLRSRFQAAGRYGSTPRVGALAIFDGDQHVEMVTAVYSTYLLCVGGNTARADGSNPWGGQVSVKKRYRSQIKGYCYPKYAGTTTSGSGSGSAVTAPFISGPTLASGSTGTYVKRVQAGLNKLIGAGLSVDGSFGPKTVAAVKRYQSRERLTADGRVGPTTQKHFYQDGVRIY